MPGHQNVLGTWLRRTRRVIVRDNDCCAVTSECSFVHLAHPDKGRIQRARAGGGVKQSAGPGREPEEVDTSPLVPCKGSMPAARKIRTCLVAFLSFYEKRNLMHMFENDSASAHCLYAVSTIVTCLSTMFLLTWSCDSISSSVFGSCR